MLRFSGHSPVDQESYSAALLFHKVKLKVDNLTSAEYGDAVQLITRKHHLPQRVGRLDLNNMSVGRIVYIGDLVAEAIGQARISRGLLDIERSARKLDEPQKSIERDETA